jgi:hypothetical protein
VLQLFAFLEVDGEEDMANIVERRGFIGSAIACIVGLFGVGRSNAGDKESVLSFAEAKQRMINYWGSSVSFHSVDCGACTCPPGSIEEGFRALYQTPASIYVVTAKKSKGGGDYLGCTMSNRYPDPGETWTRGSDLADGACTVETWNRIIRDIVRAETTGSTANEGRCQFCHRDIGAGHERYCPYYRPKRASMKHLAIVAIPLLFIAGCVLSITPAQAQDPDLSPLAAGETETESGFVQRGSYWIRNGQAYTRIWVAPVYTSTFAYGCRTSYLKSAGYYSYSRVAVARAKADVPAYGPDWKVEILKTAALRDDHRAYLEAVKALGFSSPFLASYNTYGSSSYPSLGSYGAQGSTAYGYSLKQVQEAYGTLDLNVLYQQASRLAQGSQALSRDATGDFSALVAAAGDNAARVAEIIAKARAAEIALRAAGADPSTKTTTVIQGSGTTTVPGAGPAVTPPFVQRDGTRPRMPSAPEDDTSVSKAAAFLKEVGLPRCQGCHNQGKDSKGGFDILTYPSMTLDQKKVAWKRLLSNDPTKLMPRDAKGVGYQLPVAELQRFLTN